MGLDIKRCIGIDARQVVRNPSAGDSGGNWQPTVNESGNTSGWPGNVGNIDHWNYTDTYQSGRGKAFNLDDDSGYGNTTLGAGRDSGGDLGVDALLMETKDMPNKQSSFILEVNGTYRTH